MKQVIVTNDEVETINLKEIGDRYWGLIGDNGRCLIKKIEDKVGDFVGYVIVSNDCGDGFNISELFQTLYELMSCYKGIEWKYEEDITLSINKMWKEYKWEDNS